jgi:hypothetical protein
MLLIRFVLSWSLGIGGGVSLLLFIYSGFIYTTSAGNPEKVQAAKENFTAAAGGLLVLIFSVFLLEYFGVRLLVLPGF